MTLGSLSENGKSHSLPSLPYLDINHEGTHSVFIEVHPSFTHFKNLHGHIDIQVFRRCHHKGSAMLRKLHFLVILAFLVDIIRSLAMPARKTPGMLFEWLVAARTFSKMLRLASSTV